MTAKLYIFDLDGTLYEGTDHFDYYAEKLKLDVSVSDREAYSDDYENMKAGNHPVSIGKAYDTKNDAVLTIDPMTLTVVKAEDWEGNSIEDTELQYGDRQVEFDSKDLIAIGDGWWLPFVCASHYGVKDCYPRYLQTKEYMVTDQFQLEKIAGLASFLRELKEKSQIVLLTNSDKEDVGRLLSELDLNGVFHQVFTSAQKPTRTKEFFEFIMKEYDVGPEETVSVGDNFINEIAPALLLGIHAVYISDHPQQTQHKQLTQVNRITEWIDCMTRA
ncbi:HAD family hydrolase [Bacillaceae bacterium IKA-2]|nr:HAD family hydrolase [Bacillaceae bacterium IKA-2]